MTDIESLKRYKQACLSTCICIVRKMVTASWIKDFFLGGTANISKYSTYTQDRSVCSAQTHLEIHNGINVQIRANISGFITCHLIFIVIANTYIHLCYIIWFHWVSYSHTHTLIRADAHTLARSIAHAHTHMRPFRLLLYFIISFGILRTAQTTSMQTQQKYNTVRWLLKPAKIHNLMKWNEMERSRNVEKF